jgi:two-component system response regulator
MITEEYLKLLLAFVCFLVDRVRLRAGHDLENENTRTFPRVDLFPCTHLLCMGHYVLLSVEDDNTDYYVINMAVRETGLEIEVCRVSDGEQALAFLHRSNGYEVSPRPGLILLDLNLPRKEGFEVLSDIQTSDSLRSIPVVVFTSSSLARDKEKALTLGAQDYIRKTGSLDAMAEAVRSVCSRYLAPGSHS